MDSRLFSDSVGVKKDDWIKFDIFLTRIKSKFNVGGATIQIHDGQVITEGGSGHGDAQIKKVFPKQNQNET